MPPALEAAPADILAFTPFSKDLWQQIWSNNPNERLNREIRSRTHRRHLPNRDATIRLAVPARASKPRRSTFGR